MRPLGEGALVRRVAGRARARAAARVRRRDVGAGAAQVGALGRAHRRRDPGDLAAGADGRECARRRAAVVRPRRARARRGARRDEARRVAHVVYDGKLIDVTLERWGDHEREIVEHPGAVAIVAVDARGARLARPPAARAGAQGARRAARRHARAGRGAARDGEARAARGVRAHRRRLARARRRSGRRPASAASTCTSILAEGVEPGDAEPDDDEERRDRALAASTSSTRGSARSRTPRPSPGSCSSSDRVPRARVPRVLRIGVAKEIKTDEYRVALTPAGARELVQQRARRARRDDRRRRQLVPRRATTSARARRSSRSTTSGRRPSSCSR